MWNWDQGRLEYFQFDVLRAVAQFCEHNDLATATRDELQAAIGLTFDAGPNKPWRNYARIYKSMLIVSDDGGHARPTVIGKLLATPGSVRADEYFHFLAQSTTQPSPALSGYWHDADFRYPLLFCLRYILCKQKVREEPFSTFDELIGAYGVSGFVGGEDDLAFIGLLDRKEEFAEAGRTTPKDARRQARESLSRTICQISYLHVTGNQIEASIHPSDAAAAFDELTPFTGPFESDGGAEIQRRAALFRHGSTLDFFDYPRTVVSEVVQSGFDEGGRIEKTHLVVERNVRLRKAYFDRFAPRTCDMCALDTYATYPWAPAVLDLHHKLPLASGTRVEAKGTALSDLVPVCPTCHRAIHRFYTVWLRDTGQRDFSSKSQAYEVYDMTKDRFAGHRYAH